uniref:Axin n=1 Tax=Phallusia mammillata TaxID=59560 RepID=A0A6F9D818_9ASCI|nr:axin [Phallusia mammillata]
MSKEIVNRFMLDHNFTRPPTIGEEHEASTIDRMSNHSSVSGKSEISTATPRRADGELGYNPEGSASPFPSYEKWKLSLHNVLEDTEGLSEFRKFLERSKQESILECWLAMKGFKNFGLKSNSLNSGNSSAASSTCGSLSNRNSVAITMDKETAEKRIKLAKTIYKRFMSKTTTTAVSSIIKGPTKSYITQHIKAAVGNSKSLESDLFHQAQTEIELYMEAGLYKKFLDSDSFLQYSNQYDSLSPKAGNTPHQQAVTQYSAEIKEPKATDPSHLVQHQVPAPNPGSRNLSSIDEHGVWNPAQQKLSIPNSILKTAIQQSRKENMRKQDSDFENQTYTVNQLSAASPYYTANTYFVPPASAIGSDQASKSSDATSETLSCSDKSFEGLAAHPRSSSYKRFMRKQAMQNPNNLPGCCHVPLTSRCKDIPMLAEKDPNAFFKQLKVKLDKVIDDRRKMKIEAIRAKTAAETQKRNAAAAARMKENEEDNDKILESHLAKTLQSPGGRCSPPIQAGTQRRFGPSNNNAFYGGKNYAVPGSYSNDQRSKQSNLQAGPPRPNQSLDVGFVPSMPQNEVPDVATPIIPVDKNQMINAWIQMPYTAAKNKRIQKKARYTAHDIETVPKEDMPFVHPVQSTGLTGPSNRQHRNSPLQPLAQDLSMPILDHPDVDTTIEEVKRRLIEDVDGSEDAPPNLSSLDLSGNNHYMQPGSQMHHPVAAAANNSTSFSSMGSSSQDALTNRDTHSDTDSSTETATFSNTTNIAKASSDKETTVVYFLPDEPLAYKVRMRHVPLTLGQFKAGLSSQLNSKKRLNCRYFFKKSVGQPAPFECTKDDEVLPLFEGIVLARLQALPSS